MKKKTIAMVILAGVTIPSFAVSTSRLHSSTGCLRHVAHAKKMKPASDARQICRSSAQDTHQWVSIGTGRFSDDLITGFYEVGINTYDVEVEQASDAPYLYRVVNPMQANPSKEEIMGYWDTVSFPTDRNYYIVFDVSDPQMVKMPMCDLGYEDEDGAVAVCSISAEYETLGYSYEEAVERAGTFADNIISFQQPYSCMLVQGDAKYYCNESGGTRLVLPGGVDYSVTFDNQDGFCPADDGCYHVGINTGATVPTIRYGVFDAPYDGYVEQLIAAGSECNPGDVITLDMSQYDERKLYLIVITLDASGNYQDGLYTVLYNPADNSPSWQFYSYADFTDGLLSPYLGIEPETKEVTVEQHVARPGFFRIVDPYVGLDEEDMQHCAHSHRHYIYIDASDPMNVYLEESPVGVSGEWYGDILVGHDYYFMLSEFTREELDSYGITSGGLWSDNTITFNAEASLCIYPTLFADWFVTNVHDDGSAGDFLLAFKSDPTGVSAIETDEVTYYYNLQGMQISQPQNGICIIRNGNRTSKCVINNK